MTLSADPLHEPAAATVAQRIQTDRRQRPTPMLSRYWLRGRRRQAGRRGTDATHVYVDRYSTLELSLVLWIVGSAVLDLGLTLVHLQAGGAEANPIMAWFLIHGGVPAFVSAKLGLTVLPLFLLLLHIRFRGTLMALWGLSAMYLGLLVFHVVAWWDRLAP